MSDHVTVDPRDFSVDALVDAARGNDANMRPQLAVTLLRAKLGDDAEAHLAGLANDEATDTRARHAATLALSEFPGARGTLETLRASSDPMVAQAAEQALG